jgi:hypothetical protein
MTPKRRADFIDSPQQYVPRNGPRLEPVSFGSAAGYMHRRKNLRYDAAVIQPHGPPADWGAPAILKPQSKKRCFVKG